MLLISLMAFPSLIRGLTFIPTKEKSDLLLSDDELLLVNSAWLSYGLMANIKF